MAEPTEEDWQRLRPRVWANWVADLATYASPGRNPLPYSAEMYDNVPDDLTRVPVAALKHVVRWIADREASAKNAVVFNVKTHQLEQA